MAAITIRKVIDQALPQLKEEIEGINTTPINDDDENHRIEVVFKNHTTENASIFALKANKVSKEYDSLVEELVMKVKQFLKDRQNSSLIRLTSGAFIESTLDTQIGMINGYLAVDGKIAVMKKEDKYIPLPAYMVQTYTRLKAKKENDLIIITDEHEKTRNDGKEGFVFNLQKPITLNREQLIPFDHDTNQERLKTSDTYLTLHRTRKEAL